MARAPLVDFDSVVLLDPHSSLMFCMFYLDWMFCQMRFFFCFFFLFYVSE